MVEGSGVVAVGGARAAAGGAAGAVVVFMADRAGVVGAPVAAVSQWWSGGEVERTVSLVFSASAARLALLPTRGRARRTHPRVRTPARTRSLFRHGPKAPAGWCVATGALASGPCLCALQCLSHIPLLFLTGAAPKIKVKLTGKRAASSGGGSAGGSEVRVAESERERERGRRRALCFLLDLLSSQPHHAFFFHFIRPVAPRPPPPGAPPRPPPAAPAGRPPGPPPTSPCPRTPTWRNA